MKSLLKQKTLNEKELLKILGGSEDLVAKSTNTPKDGQDNAWVCSVCLLRPQ